MEKGIKGYFKLNLGLYRGERIVKILGSHDKEEKCYLIVLHTDRNRAIVLDIKES